MVNYRTIYTTHLTQSLLLFSYTRRKKCIWAFLFEMHSVTLENGLRHLESFWRLSEEGGSSAIIHLALFTIPLLWEICTRWRSAEWTVDTNSPLRVTHQPTAAIGKLFETLALALAEIYMWLFSFVTKYSFVIVPYLYVRSLFLQVILLWRFIIA
jgi:hypothetical protein